MKTSAREEILAAARRTAQAHGYSGLNYRHLAEEVGIKAASIHHHFPLKEDLGAAVAKRYSEDSDAVLKALFDGSSDPVDFLRDYPDTFRRSLESENRMCLGSFMGAEYDDLPEAVKREVQAFADVNIAWISKALSLTAIVDESSRDKRAHAIFAAIAGAQLIARSRSDISLFDTLIESYREAGLLPG